MVVPQSNGGGGRGGGRTLRNELNDNRCDITKQTAMSLKIMSSKQCLVYSNNEMFQHSSF